MRNASIWVSVNLWVAVAVIVVVIAVVWLAQNRYTTRAAQCPIGTYYIPDADACLYGVRPWEVQP